MIANTGTKMRIFQNIRQYFEAAGTYSQQTYQAQPFNAKIALILLFFIIIFMSTSAFFVFKATDMFEYAICFYFGITRPTAIAIYLTIWIEMPQTIQFIENCEQFVEASE